MMALISSLLAVVALGAEPDRVGLPFGIPPGPDDPVIARVAPEKCLFYVNWTGTAVPDPNSRSAMEQLLAEPEVQVFVKSIGTWFRKSTALNSAMVVPEGPDKAKLMTDAAKAAAAKAQKEQAEIAGTTLDLFEVAMTHPTALFVVDFRPPVAKPAELKAPAAQKSPAPKTKGKETPKPAEAKASATKTPDAKTPPKADPPQPDTEFFDGHAGLVVALGSDAPRVRAIVEKLMKTDAGKLVEPFQLGGQTWYRMKGEGEKGEKGVKGEKGKKEKKSKKKNEEGGKGPLVEFGFQGNDFILAVGDGVLQGILKRLGNKEPPAWYTTALKQTPVPRRTGIIYLNAAELRELVFKTIKGQPDGDATLLQAKASLEVFGLDRATSLVSTTGLDDNGMVNKVLLTIDGKPQGLLQLVSEHPLKAADLTPIPRDATLALAVRIDLQKALDMVLSALENANPAARVEAARQIAQFEQLLGIDLHRFLGALGDTWCIYNSPGEGGCVLTGLTAVVPLRDAGLFSIGYAKLLGLAKQQMSGVGRPTGDAGLGHMQQFRFGRYEVNYMNFMYMSPAWCVTDHELILALNAYNIKAYLGRRGHQPLSVVPEVAQALGAADAPTILAYCDAPKLFEIVYPWASMMAQATALGMGQMHVDASLEFWPSAPSISRHLRPEVSTVHRTADGIQFTSHYCLPTGGAIGPMFLLYSAGMSAGFVRSYSAPDVVEPAAPTTTTITPGPTVPTYNATPTPKKSNAPAAKPKKVDSGKKAVAPAGK